MQKNSSEARGTRLHVIVSAAIAVFVVLFDQFTKWLVVKFLDREEPIEIIKGVFRFTYVENEGAAFGMLKDSRWVFMIISVVAIIGLSIYIWKFAPRSFWVSVPVSFIIGGGIGNMIDRMFRYGIDVYGEKYYYVVDFLDFCAFPRVWQYVFNVADSFVCVGAAILFVWCIVTMKDEVKASKSTNAEEEKNTVDTNEN